MSEAILTRSGGSSSGSSGDKYNYIFTTEVYSDDTNFIVPKAKNQEFDVRIFGAGGGSYFCGNGLSFHACAAGGGGGYMNNAILTLAEGEIIKVTIGVGGNSGHIYSSNAYLGMESSETGVERAGGSTFFGGLLSANGGSGGSWAYPFANGGNGGSGGGAASYRSTYESFRCYGGTGSQFGGGGACCRGSNNTNSYAQGGNGGIWGGGGGSYATNWKNCKIGYGGANGGNGGNRNIAATNGINTIGFINDANLAGYGVFGKGTMYNNSGGGGGYGGNGGGSYEFTFSWGGGGGGYGAEGGGDWGGGGGGYGVNAKGGWGPAGGGGSYGQGGSFNSTLPGFGGGDAARVNNITNAGGKGICIIQYYKAVKIE